MIRILLAHNNAPIPNSRWQYWLSLVPQPLHHAIFRYKRWQDQQAALLGKLLVRQGLLAENHTEYPLKNWQVTPYGKPRVAEDIYFNISHTQGLVVCAMSRQGEVGIDCEQIRSIELTDFKSMMKPAVWETIMTAQDKEKAFFNDWTQRESVLKADGRGLSIPLEALTIDNNQATLCTPDTPQKEQSWHIFPVDVGAGYCCHLATSVQNPVLTLTMLNE
ncbi:MAG: 4'-phosphopantetheinyl transferase superfamily protein [Magnetococcales bacterium]|nr:4'-phosphopantetheinyl transferase superfamily protein [Magnetococcales bacterium]